MNRLVLVLALGASLAPGVAAARSVVLAPLIGNDPKASTNVSQLISSELDFNPEVDEVIELGKPPSTLNAACLKSSSCLSGIVRAAGGDQLVTGSLATTASTYTLDLVLYDAKTSKIVRSKSFTLPASSEDVADGMNSIVKELLTGSSPSKAAAAVPSADDFKVEDDADDFAFDAGEDPGDFDIADFEEPEDEEAAARAAEDERRKVEAAAKAKAAEEARRKQDEEDRRKAEEERRRQEEIARQKAEDDERRRQQELARQKAEEEERRKEEAAQAKIDAANKAKADAAAKAKADAAAKAKAEEDARSRTAAAEDEEEEEEEFDPSMISFGSSADAMVIEDAEDIQFAPSTPSSASSASGSTGSRSSSRYYDEEEELDLEEEEAGDDVDLASLDDEPRGRSSGSSARTDSSRSSSSREPSSREPSSREPSSREPERASSSRDSGSAARIDRDDEGSSFQLTARGGYSKYHSFNFVTAGAEAAIGVTPTVFLLAGIESYSVQRTIPPALQGPEGKSVEWNTIYPLNAGVVYKGGQGGVKPYVGADLIFAPYYFDENGAPSFAVGGRARAGADFMVAPAFGFNLNVAAGFWSGKDWILIQRDLKAQGMLPQVSAGTVFAF